ncbi:MAG: hypothetical protein JSW65_06690 [Candidatus Bipolaricaulota bacterium]|nr:MAG: hypothetical protein JSW65_06690 [Candidatus Bipolaricaulota bacterium]
MKRWVMPLTILGLALGIALPAISQGASLALWEMPYPDMFPAGLAVDVNGMVYVATAGSMAVYRLDPATDTLRSWGVGNGPEGVIFADGAFYCSVSDDNLLVYAHPDGLATNSVRLPAPDLGVTELHRGANTADGKLVFWMAEREATGVLRYLFDTAHAATASGSPTDQPATKTVQALTAAVVTTTHETFAYDTSLMPAPYALQPSHTSTDFTEWRLPLQDFLVEDIAVAADGKVWISAGLPSIFLLDPATNMIREMETIQNVRIFQGLLPDPDGSIWFGNIIEGAVGHFHPGTGLSETWRIPGTGEVYDLVFDGQGRIWYTDRTGDAIGRLDTATGEALVYSLPSGSEPLYLELDGKGNVWFTLGSGNAIGRLSIGN